MNETLKYLKEQFEKNHSNLPWFKYLGADEERKDTYFESMIMYLGEGRNNLVSTSISDCWRLPKCNGVRFFDIKHFYNYNKYPAISCRFVDVTGVDDVILGWLENHFDRISNADSEIDKVFVNIGKYFKNNPNYLSKWNSYINSVYHIWPDDYPIRKYKVKYIPTYYEYFDVDEHFEAKVAEFRIPVLCDKDSKDLTVLLQVRKNLDTNDIQLYCMTRTLNLKEDDYPELDSIDHEVNVSIKEIGITGGSIELNHYIDSVIYNEIMKYVQTKEDLNTKILERLLKD